MTSVIEALLVDNNLGDARLVEQLINSSELTKPTLHHTHLFNDAIATLETTPVDVVLLDMGLSNGNGISLLKRLRTKAPQVPIVAMNSVSDHEMAVAAIREGAQDYLVKPDVFSAERLQKLGYTSIGNLLVTTLQYAIQRAELTQQLAISKERYELAVQGSNDGIWDWDLIHQTIYYSDRWLAMLGLTRQHIKGQPREWLSRIHPDDRQHFQQCLKQHLNQQHPQFMCEHRLLHSDQTYRWVLSRGTSLRDEQGVAYRIAGSQTDITARKALENSLHQETELAKITLHSIGDAVITTDEQGYIQNFNPVAARLTGWSEQDARDTPIADVCRLIDGVTRLPLSNPVMESIKANGPICLSQQTTLVSKTGEEFAISESIAPMRSQTGDIVGTVMVVRDVTEERSHTKQLTWQAHHDPLTQLHNRTSFLHSLTQALQNTPSSQHVLCYLDLDHFKAVNDRCGHTAGDQLLKQIADLWRSQIRTSDILARLGGDEFGLLLYNCDIDRATQIAEEFCQKIQDFRFGYDNYVFRIGVSIGLVATTQNIANTAELLALADHACYQAKEKGRNCVYVYSASQQTALPTTSGNQWKSKLTHAIENNHFELHYQEIYATDHVVESSHRTDASATRPKHRARYEASHPAKHPARHQEILLRLPDASGQLLPPMGFIPTAERYQLMTKIDRWVVESVLQRIAERPSLRHDTYSINLSASSLNDEHFLSFVQRQLARYCLPAQCLCFEITETDAIANMQNTSRFVRSLKQLGCTVALDNFGSGIIGLNHVKSLKLDYLKIDSQLIEAATADPTSQLILSSIQNISQAMNIETVAKSVENTAVLSTIRAVGIDYMQGYVISPPQPLL